ncbi:MULTISPECIES: ribonuclease E inhibitor RraB [unclassified Duganella]|uniref:ribonuclease E inhibitor RraB n=1 Tax=unclassified Duganella TaxID=2636909 RepID=UPI000E3508D2|nr:MULTISPECIES: ribonuclease E inhibitor RraB [unclassified Duganella]RFP14561.1 ribonuclease E inhibitor RraB [Duganella sp. BJB475]RFP30909.1 ribonuclease E inhibitor RraB [Duganella sp. BJB476]
MITKEDMVELFADMKQNAPWDISKPLLWGYFFADTTKAKLEGVSALLKAQGYQIVGIYDSKPEASVPALWWLHVEKVEHHTADTLHVRNQEFYKFAEEHQLESYDGMDVGPAA